MASKKLTPKEFKAQQVKACAIRQNPIEFRIALPPDVDLDDIAWKPTQLERKWARLARIDAKFEKQQDQYRRERVKILQSVIDADLKWLAEHKDD